MLTCIGKEPKYLLQRLMLHSAFFLKGEKFVGHRGEKVNFRITE